MDREITLQLPVELVERLDRFGRNRNASRSEIVRSAVDRLLTDPTDEDIDELVGADYYTARPHFPVPDVDPVRSLIREEPW